MACDTHGGPGVMSAAGCVDCARRYAQRAWANSLGMPGMGPSGGLLAGAGPDARMISSADLLLSESQARCRDLEALCQVKDEMIRAQAAMVDGAAQRILAAERERDEARRRVAETMSPLWPVWRGAPSRAGHPPIPPMPAPKPAMPLQALRGGDGVPR